MLPLLIPLAPHLVRAATSRRPQQQPQLRPTPQTTPTPAPTPTRSTPLDIALRAGPAFAGHLVGSRLDLLTAPARAINPDIPLAREQFAARPMEMVKGGLIGASLITGVAGGAALLGGGGAVAAAGPAASGIIRTGGGAALGLATRTAPAVVQQGATAAATAAGTMLPIALANEITPTFPDPSPQFPTGRPGPEIGGGRNPYVLGPGPIPHSTWDPGQAELGTGDRVSRLVLQGPTTPIGTREITLRNDLAEIQPRADAWSPGGAEVLTRPRTEARFHATEAIPSPSPFGGPSAFPDAFPNVFPTGPRGFVADEDTPFIQAPSPEVPAIHPGEETVRYIFTPRPETVTKPDIATWTKTLNLAEASTRDATADLTADLFAARSTFAPMTAPLSMAIPTSTTTDITIPETAYPDTTVFQNPLQNPVDYPYPPSFPNEFPFETPFIDQTRRRDRDPTKRKKKGGRGSKAETAFWENLRVATPREFLGLSPSPTPRKKPAKRRKR